MAAPRLALETSGRSGSLCLETSSGDRESTSLPSSREFSRVLAPRVEELLRRHGVEARELCQVVVGTGPGSYTGMRIGASFASGLARATGATLIGVPSFDAWVAAIPTGAAGALVPAVDARRGRVYWGRYETRDGGWQRVGAFSIAQAEELQEAVGMAFLCFGSGWEKNQQLLEACGGRAVVAPDCPPAEHLFLHAASNPSGPPRLLYLKPTENVVL